MLDEQALENLYDQLNLSPEARALVNHIRTSPPERRVQGGKYSNPVRFVSQKMQCVIQAESAKNELPQLRKFETDSDVFEMYDQPASIVLHYLSKSGRAMGVRHTPDYLLICRDSIKYIECKTESELESLAQTSPNRYMKDDSGKWRCPPGEAYAAQYGLGYEVLSSNDISWNFQRNVDFLADFWLETCPSVPDKLRDLIYEYIKTHLGSYLSDLLDEFPDISRDYIYTLIAQSTVYVDLDKAPITERDRVRVYPDKLIADAFVADRGEYPSFLETHSIVVEEGTLLDWDEHSWKIVNVGQTKITLISEDKKMTELENHHFAELVRQGRLLGTPNGANSKQSDGALELLKRAGPEDLKIAAERMLLIRPYLEGDPSPKGLSVKEVRKIYRYKAHYRAAELKYGHSNGMVGLLPKLHQSGNRISRLEPELEALITKVIEDHYETVKQKNYVSVYGTLRNECRNLGLEPPSYKTFIKRCKNRNHYEQIVARKGLRAAYAEEPKYLELFLTTPRHGERIFQFCHMDHTELDLELVHSQTGKNLGKAYATFLTDAFSRRILVAYLSFDPPSYRTLMMVLRESVRRYNRLPQYLVVDHGKEFSSTYFETLLVSNKIHKVERRSAKPRDGSTEERVIGTTNTQFVYNLVGNTQITKNVRQVTKSVNPKNHALWTLDRLYTRLQEWAYEVYDTREHPALGQNPREAFLASESKHGSREHTFIPYDDAFIFKTLPTTPKGTAKVQTNVGVRINHLDYWSEKMRDPEVENTNVEVRFDPFDAGIAYARIKGQWVKCISSYYTQFQGRSEKYIRIAAEELRRQKQVFNQNFSLRAADLARFVSSLESEEAEVQRIRDSEGSGILASINGDDPVMSRSDGAPRLSSKSPIADDDTDPSTIDGTENSGPDSASPSRPRRDLPIL